MAWLPFQKMVVSKLKACKIRKSRDIADQARACGINTQLFLNNIIVKAAELLKAKHINLSTNPEL